VLYAAYGSNLHPGRLSRRLASARLLGTAFLADWSLRFHKRSVDASGKCSIASGSSGVHFAIYQISEADKQVLDKIEGAGSGYTEIGLVVPGYGSCFSYTASETHIDDSLAPYDWYKELVLAGAQALGFPAAYIDTIRGVGARTDPDLDRHQQMWDLVDLIEVQGFHLPREGVAPPAE